MLQDLALYTERSIFLVGTFMYGFIARELLSAYPGSSSGFNPANANPRISVSVTSMLTLIAYLTRMDWFILGSSHPDANSAK